MTVLRTFNDRVVNFSLIIQKNGALQKYYTQFYEVNLNLLILVIRYGNAALHEKLRSQDQKSWLPSESDKQLLSEKCSFLSEIYQYGGFGDGLQGAF